eukprot:7201110-Prymnesium_polylepis.1
MLLGHFLRFAGVASNHDCLELERPPRAVWVNYTCKLVARLQVHAQSHRLPYLGRKRLWLVRPRVRVEVDQHVVARGHVAPLLEEHGFKQVIDLVDELGGPQIVRAAVHLDRRAPPGRREARRPLQVDVAVLLG